MYKGALLPETTGISAASDQYWPCTFCLNLSLMATPKKAKWEDFNFL